MSSSPRAVVVGAGPNGLTAAARLLKAGWDVDIYEAASTPGGAARSSTQLFAGATVDLGAAGHPFSVASPLRELKLEEHGLTWMNALLRWRIHSIGRNSNLVEFFRRNRRRTRRR